MRLALHANGYLKQERLFGAADALFPPPNIQAVDGEFKVTGLKREIYKNTNAIRQAIKQAFIHEDLSNELIAYRGQENGDEPDRLSVDFEPRCCR